MAGGGDDYGDEVPTDGVSMQVVSVSMEVCFPHSQQHQGAEQAPRGTLIWP